ncbi:hypothetical protein QCA50_004969 [Cerrena zonata]|uniref:Uncharacterized protein n=1 Tax=Cerrena zonata TaxID=2478898 RepID=A0AAW0GQT0_9APHY
MLSPSFQGIALICSLFVTINTLQSSSNGPIDWFMALYSLAGSRLILNLREAAAGNTVNYSVSELSTWQAAPGRNRYTNSDMELGTIFTYRIGGETSSSSVDS